MRLLLLIGLVAAGRGTAADPGAGSSTNALPPPVVLTAQEDHQRMMDLLQIPFAGDRLRTFARSRVTLRWTDQSAIRLGESGDFQIDQVPAEKRQGAFNFLAGRLYFFHRGKPADLRFRNRSATAAVRGTEFHLLADDTKTVVTVLDGEIELSNEASNRWSFRFCGVTTSPWIPGALRRPGGGFAHGHFCNCQKRGDP